MSLDDAMAQADAEAAASDEDDASQAAGDDEESMAEYDEETADRSQATDEEESMSSDTDQTDAVNAAIAGAESAPEMEAVQDTPEATATIDGDLKAIDRDAKELKSYQEQSLKEI